MEVMRALKTKQQQLQNKQKIASAKMQRSFCRMFVVLNYFRSRATRNI